MGSSHLSSAHCLAAAVAVALGTTSLGAQPPGANYDEAKVPVYTLPDPLVLLDGKPVTDAKTWQEKRRAEILRLFEEHVYGKSPGRPSGMRFVVLESDPKALDGRATRRQVRILLAGREDGPAMDLLLYLPNGAGGRKPAFLALNFQGNHAVHSDPAIRLSERWIAAGEGVVDHRATAASRGAAASRWPAETLMKRGYALATCYYGDIEPDRDGAWKEGVRGHFGPGAFGNLGPTDWGAIGAWAWGLSRALDYLATDPDIDGARVAVLGHSRLGKTALWAAAQDERFALAVSNNSGAGGAALARRRFGETVAFITSAFPHWFSLRHREYADRESALPVDQHMLLALTAPRPLYVASAEEDLWADPRGEFLAARAADPVYRLLGTEGLGTEAMPAVDTPIGKTIGYHVRRGRHDLTVEDWKQYVAFADRHLAPK
jgi:hypothetical protein